MSWTCFPGQKGPTNRNSNSRSHAQSNGDHTGAEPPKTGILSVPWNQAQESTPHEGTPSHPDPIEVSLVLLSQCLETDMQEIVRITDVKPPYDRQNSRLQEAKITALYISSAGTSYDEFSYAQLQSLPGGSQALTEFQNDPNIPFSFRPTSPLGTDAPYSSNAAPPLPMAPESMWSRWLRWFLGRKRRPHASPNS